MTNRCDAIHTGISNNDSRPSMRTIINSDSTNYNCQHEQTEQDRQIQYHRKQNQSIISLHRSSNNNNASISLGSATAKTTKTTEESTSAFRSSVGIPSYRKRRHRRRHKSFFDDDITSPIKKDTTGDTLSCNAKTTPMAKNMNDIVDITENIPSSSKDVTALSYQRKSPTSVVLEPQQSQRLHNGEEEEDIFTTSTIQSINTGMSTYLSNSDVSTVESSSSSMSSPASHPVMIIETELSNLTESPASDTNRMDNAMDIYSTDTISSRNGVTPTDQLQSSMIRLHELELKRNVLRHQRFSLEQRLYNFCSASPSFVGRSKQPMDAIVSQHSTKQQHQISLPAPLEEGEEEEAVSSHQKKVINWSFSTDDYPLAEAMALQSPALPPQTVIYTGYLNVTGRPHDDDGVLQFADGQIYKGSVREGERHGWGTNKWPENGQTYSGEWRHNSRCGMGTHTWKDKTVTGMWKDGHLHGQVYFQWADGGVYDGIAVYGKKEGRGVSTLSDGSVYNGHFAKGKEEGFGTLIRPDGTKYRGYFQKGKKEGYGIMLWKDRTYDGQWLEGKPHGSGRVVWSNGTVFTGQFQQGKYEGSGVYIWPSGKKFVGRWQDGVKTGHGLYTWPSGKKYDGEYKDGMKGGYGRLTWADGSTYCGGFKRDQRCGRGIQIDTDGRVIHCGLWKNNRPYHSDDESQASVGTLLMPHLMNERMCI